MRLASEPAFPFIACQFSKLRITAKSFTSCFALKTANNPIHLSGSGWYQGHYRQEYTNVFLFVLLRYLTSGLLDVFLDLYEGGKKKNKPHEGLGLRHR